MLVFSGEVFADFFQFYIADVGKKLADLPMWNEEEVQRRLAISNGLVAFRTLQNHNVPVSISIHSEKPDNELGAAHIAECSMESSGKLMIAGCTDFAADAAQFSVRPGRLRVSYECVEPEAATENDVAENCHYFIKLWPSEDLTVAVTRETPRGGW